jgi:YidC/Oxa1 family membrane protein insertase
VGEFLTTFIGQPIFNLLVLIYALLPGHNFGLAIILFTIVVRLLLWPLLRRQLHQTKKMRRLQPELKRIKKEAKGDRQKESAMVMALYKEAGINPLSQIGMLLLQVPILIALYNGLRLVVNNPKELVSFAYPALQHLPWMQALAQDIHRFDGTLFGVVDLTRAAVDANSVYFPALVIVLGSVVVQYFQGKQLLVTDKNARSVRQILRAAANGEEADQAEISAAMTGLTRYFIPAMVLAITIHLPSALGLYWLVGGLIAFAQQSHILREDETELEALADKHKPASRDLSAIPEAEVLPSKAPKSATSNTSKKRKRRRKR